MAKSKQIVNFVYSYPYEGVLLKISGDKLTGKHSDEVMKKTRFIQKIWNKHELKVLQLFEEMYQMKVSETYIKAFISQASPNSFSNPLTISLRFYPDLATSDRSQRGIVYSIIHELAHYFAYTQYPHNYFNKLYKMILKKDLLGSHGKNLHYLIQAVEFGIVGEIFGTSYAEYSRNWVIENWKNTEYSASAEVLKKNNVPLDKSCLKYIKSKVL